MPLTSAKHHTRQTNAAILNARKIRERMVDTATELPRICTAAAVAALPGEAWSDVEECGFHLYLLTLETIRERTGQVTLAIVPAKFCAMDTLKLRALDWIDSLRATRRREAEALAVASSLTGHLTATITDPLSLTTPANARKLAVQVLRSAGLLAPGEAVAWGPVWTTVYAACRGLTGEDSDTLAAELDLTPATFRQHLSRGRKILRERGTVADWMDALGCEDDPHAGTEHPTVSALPSNFDVAVVRERTDGQTMTDTRAIMLGAEMTRRDRVKAHAREGAGSGTRTAPGHRTPNVGLRVPRPVEQARPLECRPTGHGTHSEYRRAPMAPEMTCAPVVREMPVTVGMVARAPRKLAEWARPVPPAAQPNGMPAVPTLKANPRTGSSGRRTIDPLSPFTRKRWERLSAR